MNIVTNLESKGHGVLDEGCFKHGLERHEYSADPGSHYIKLFKHGAKTTFGLGPCTDRQYKARV